jgi:hypothetical protein
MMSLASMVDTKLARDKGADPAVVSPMAPQGVPTNILNQITRWIPTETVTVYVAFLSLFGTPVLKSGQQASDLSYTSRWLLLALVALATPIVVILITMAKTTTGRPFQWPIFEMVVGTIAFVAWAVALPDTPLSDFKDYDVKFNGAILIAVTLAIVLVANALKRSPDLDQVQTVAQGATAGPPPQ